MAEFKSQKFQADTGLLAAIADSPDAPGQPRISQNQNRTAVPSVQIVQEALVIWRSDALADSTPDGEFGRRSAAAVHRFKAEGLDPPVPEDQIIDDVGPRTVKALDEICANAEHTAPAIRKVDPHTGPRDTRVTISGSGLSRVKDVTFEGFGSGVSVAQTDNELQVIVPDGMGAVTLTAANDLGEAATAAYSFAPIVTRLKPDRGASEGSPVQIEGEGLRPVTRVDFGSTTITSFDPPGEFAMQVVVPAGSGSVNVTVSGDRGGPSEPKTFLYPPQITALTPPGGRVGAEVTISGTGFSDVHTVNFRSASGTAPAQITSTPEEHALHVVAPEGSGQAFVTVISEQAGSSKEATFEYQGTQALFPTTSAPADAPQEQGTYSA